MISRESPLINNCGNTRELRPRENTNLVRQAMLITTDPLIKSCQAVKHSELTDFSILVKIHTSYEAGRLEVNPLEAATALAHRPAEPAEYQRKIQLKLAQFP